MFENQFDILNPTHNRKVSGNSRNRVIFQSRDKIFNSNDPISKNKFTREVQKQRLMTIGNEEKSKDSHKKEIKNTIKNSPNRQLRQSLVSQRSIKTLETNKYKKS